MGVFLRQWQTLWGKALREYNWGKMPFTGTLGEMLYCKKMILV
jgi:hypothetical protein